MTLGSNQPEAALVAMNKRKAQLDRWRGSETEKESTEIRNRPKRIKFADKCIFQAACAANDKGQVAKMIQEGYDINAVDEDGITALHQACIEDNFDMVEFLLKNGADVNISDNEGWTPLHAVATCCYVSIAKLLLEFGANVVAINNDCSIPIDICKSDEIRELFIQAINGQGIDLKEARKVEEMKMMDDAKKWMICGKWEEIPHGTTGATAMHVAACKGYIKVLDKLIKAGANLNKQDFDGWTPLHAAAYWDQKEACEILLENNADINIKNNCGQTSYDLADLSVIPILEDYKRRREFSSNKENEAKICPPDNKLNILPLPPKKKSNKPEDIASTSDVIRQSQVSSDEEMIEEKMDLEMEIEEAEDTVSELRSCDSNSTSTSINIDKNNVNNVNMINNDLSSNSTSSNSSNSSNNSNSTETYHSAINNPTTTTTTTTTTTPTDNNTFLSHSELQITPEKEKESNNTSTTGSKNEGESSGVKLLSVRSSSEKENLNLNLVSPTNSTLIIPSPPHTIAPIPSSTTTTSMPNIKTPTIPLPQQHPILPRLSTKSESQQSLLLKEPSEEDSSSSGWRRGGSLRTNKASVVPVVPVDEKLLSPNVGSGGENKLSVRRTRSDDKVPTDVNLRRAYSFESDSKKDTDSRVVPARPTTISTSSPEVAQKGSPNANNSNNIQSRSGSTGEINHKSPTAGSVKQSPVSKFKQFLIKSFVPPARDEESETQRKAHAKRVRETRRSTQGVTLEELKSAEQYVKSMSVPGSGQDTTTTGTTTGTTSTGTTGGSTTSLNVSNLSAAAALKKEDDQLERRPSWRLRVDDQDRSKFSLEDTRNVPSATRTISLSANLIDQNVPLSSSGGGQPSPGHKIKNPGRNDPMTGPTPTGRPPISTSGVGHHDNDNEDRDRDLKNNSGGVQGSILRKKKSKRRSTGVVRYNADGTEEKQENLPSDSEGGSGRSSVLSGESDVTGTDFSKNENGVTPNKINYRKLYEEILKENHLLKTRLARSDEEILDLKLKMDKITATPRIAVDDSETAKKEKRALERKLSEMEEELKEIRHMRMENQKLRDENGALIRVISKLSK